MEYKEREKIQNSIFKDCDELAKKKGFDYAGGNGDTLAYFKNGGRIGVTKFQSWGEHFFKQVDVISNSIKRSPENPQVESEPLRSRIIDAINYLVLLECLMEENEKK
jgi:hypothetical protein